MRPESNGRKQSVRRHRRVACAPRPVGSAHREPGVVVGLGGSAAASSHGRFGAWLAAAGPGTVRLRTPPTTAPLGIRWMRTRSRLTATVGLAVGCRGTRGRLFLGAGPTDAKDSRRGSTRLQRRDKRAFLAIT